MDSSLANQQLLVLKVMRLARPKLTPGSSFSTDPADPSEFGQLIENAYRERSGEDSTDLILGQYVLAPVAFE